MGVELSWCSAKKKTAKQYREVMSKPVIQYDMDVELLDPSETKNPDFAGYFNCVQNYSDK